jgi:hypothetical protein
MILAPAAVAKSTKNVAVQVSSNNQDEKRSALMGFGLLLIGYAFSLRVELANGLDIFPNLWGISILLAAMFLLGRYQAQFRQARLPLYIRFGVEAAILVCLFFPQSNAFFWIARIARGVSVALDAWFHYHLLLGLYAICTQVKLPKMAGKAQRNLQFAVIYFPLALIYALALPILGRYTVYFSVIFPLVELIFIFLNLFRIFACYQNICLSQDNQKFELPLKGNQNKKG